MDLNFYSSRTERLSQASSATKKAYEKRKKVGYFKKNPHMRILIIDLILVLLFGVIIIPFFVKLTRDIRFDDYKVTSKAIEFDGNILVSIKVSKLYKQINQRISTDALEITISYDESTQTKTDKLPIKAGEDKYITFKLDDKAIIEIINVRISSGDYEKSYNIKVDR